HIARDIIRWMDEWLSDRERGGFYASQDADINLDDDGDYFTWTLEEARAVVDSAELDFAARYWDLGELGDMHHNSAKNVLHRKFSMEDLAAQIGRTPEELQWLHNSARRKLLGARAERPTLFID